jgi:predicted transcriptional regulator
MGTEEAALSAVITRNIDQARKDQDISKNELALRANIPKSTFYRNMQQPEDFTFKEIGKIAKALDRGVLDLLKDTA